MRRPRPGFAGGAGQPIPQPGPSGPAFINGVTVSTSTQAGYFTDQYGHPRLWVFDWIEGLLTNGGRWNGSGGGTYQQDFDNYCSQRAAQGLTAMLVEHIGNNNNGGLNANGNTWDGVAPFNTGQDPTSGLNSAYWTRVDYLFNSAQANGLTVYPIFDMYCAQAGACFSGWTNSQYQAFGAAMGARYKNQPNLMWLFGDDTFPGTFDTQFNAIRTGLASAGDTHLVAPVWESEFTARYETDNNSAASWGVTNASFNDCYSYNASYWVIEYAYGEVANQGASSLLTPVWCNGYHFQGCTASFSSTFDRALRQECWWCLTAGGRGMLTYDVDCYNWSGSSDPGQVTGAWFFANNLKNIVTTYTSWTGWNTLLPDLSSAFVTSGRGTRVSGITAGNAGGVYEPAFTNSWVSASITPDGKLACCYLPNHTTITVNTALLTAGWSANWIDPVTGAASSAGTSGTYNSTAKGSNSKGNPDWVLVFQGP